MESKTFKWEVADRKSGDRSYVTIGLQAEIKTKTRPSQENELDFIVTYTNSYEDNSLIRYTRGMTDIVGPWVRALIAEELKVLGVDKVTGVDQACIKLIAAIRSKRNYSYPRVFEHRLIVKSRTTVNKEGNKTMTTASPAEHNPAQESDAQDQQYYLSVRCSEKDISFMRRQRVNTSDSEMPAVKNESVIEAITERVATYYSIDKDYLIVNNINLQYVAAEIVEFIKTDQVATICFDRSISGKIITVSTGGSTNTLEVFQVQPDAAIGSAFSRGIRGRCDPRVIRVPECNIDISIKAGKLVSANISIKGSTISLRVIGTDEMVEFTGEYGAMRLATPLEQSDFELLMKGVKDHIRIDTSVGKMIIEGLDKWGDQFINHRHYATRWFAAGDGRVIIDK